jgi:hypothetical protein
VGARDVPQLNADAIVIGGGFAGTERGPPPLRSREDGSSSSKGAPRWAAGRRHSPIPRPASVSTTGNTCCLAVIATPSTSFGGLAPRVTSTCRSGSRSTSSIAAGAPLALRARRSPPPLNLLGGLMTWPALGWRDRFAALPHPRRDSRVTRTRRVRRR